MCSPLLTGPTLHHQPVHLPPTELPAGAGLTDVSCREIGVFEKPSGMKPGKCMPYELLMALGTKPAQ